MLRIGGQAVRGGLSFCNAAVRRRFQHAFMAQADPAASPSALAAAGADSAVMQAIAMEQARQRNQLIMIPSESACINPSASVTSSCFGNIYAEGSADLRLCRRNGLIAENDENLYNAWHARLSDGRFYRGCIGADRVEALARHYISRSLSLLADSPDAEQLYVCIQALSGGPANLAIYQGLLDHGDSILTLDLTNGGHLSHGSPYNVSGQFYKASHYGIDDESGRLNYDTIRKQARQAQPKLIVAGYSAYPWDVDWAEFRSIADDVGALLLADCSHLAGLIISGQLNNPVPHADVIMFTTHKTLLGPRGAAIVTKDYSLGKKIEHAIFPGLQGGPHMNSIAAIARHFEYILDNRDEFCALQREVVRTSQVLSDALQEQGFSIAYGGTETHMLLVDLKDFKTANGEVLDGETASRLLERIGIICNKNTLPQDSSSSDASGLRLSTAWLVQRGVTDEQIRNIACVMRDLLGSAVGFKVWCPTGDQRYRAKVPWQELAHGKQAVSSISHELPFPGKLPGDELIGVIPMPSAVTGQGRSGILIRGDKALMAANEVLTCNALSLQPGEIAQGYMLQPDGQVIDDVVVANLGRTPHDGWGTLGQENVGIFPNFNQYHEVVSWLSSVSEGHTMIRGNDAYAKISGPFTVEPLEDTSPLHRVTLEPAHELSKASATMLDVTKPFFVGQDNIPEKLSQGLPALPRFEPPAPTTDLRYTVLHQWHQDRNAKMANFAGWDMPIEYPDTGIFKEHAAVRSAAGLFDVTHMSAISITGPGARPFLEDVCANYLSRLEDNEAQYTYMLREDGSALDDLYVYKLSPEEYMVVVNASNFECDLAWLNAVNNGEVCIDNNAPYKQLSARATITPLREADEASLIGFAFQGPLSADVLAELTTSSDAAKAVRKLTLNNLTNVELAGVPVMLAGTGYTGSSVGFEVFVHPDHALHLWNAILDQGSSRGVVPVGLGARDSLRIEAGFPLFGHELEGPEHLSLTEAGYGFVSRLHHPFYIGRDAYVARHNEGPNKQLVRLTGQGRRAVRAGHAILDKDGNPVGTVTSAAFTSPDFRFVALAAVQADFAATYAKPHSKLNAARATPSQISGPVDSKKVVELEVLPRFPTQSEKAAWADTYAEFQ
eukprot:m.15388 g.15388  ORF g.15388 m.15388 type:complete len:1122 (-) comp5011_c0_seq1:110-3475(-)